jgi:uncharacterized membrane protein
MTDTGAAHQPLRRAPRWLLVVLFASLALNLVIVGLLAGAIWRFSMGPAWAGAVAPNLVGFASTLPPERRKMIWEQTIEERRQLRPFRREVRAAREETVKALLAEPYDRQQFLAAELHKAEAERRASQAVQDLFVKIADALTPEERRAFSSWRAHRRGHHTLLDEPDYQAAEPSNPTK